MSDAAGVTTAVGRKAALRATFERLAAVADAVGLASTARDIRSVRLPRLEDEQVSLVVLGEFNHGKSTFINALLGEPVLPIGVTPTTATLVLLSGGPAFAAEAVFADGSKRALSREELPAHLTVDGAADRSAATAPAVERVHITHPAPFLADRVTIVDTPGVNDLAEQRSDITWGYIPRAEAVILLLDATQILTASERRFLEERVLKSARDRIVFVVAKADLLDEAELSEALAFARKHLSVVVADPPLYPVSAKRYLGGRRAESGMEPLLAHLGQLLGHNRRRLVFDHALVDAARLAGFVRRAAGMRQAALALDEGELAQRLRIAEQRATEGRRLLTEASDIIASEAAALKARVRQDLEPFARELQERLRPELAAASPEDVARYLDAFLEDTWKAWLDREGEMMAEALEALAEKVVTIANETLDGIGRDVGLAIAATDPGAALGWKALGAEASVFALGAVGTTALLFVSALMGGVVAALTPLAAAFVRRQAAREAKEEAQRRVPEAIARVTEALPVKLDALIDGFAARLEAFITEAGEALARGVVEVLERARDDRRTGVPAAHLAALAPVLAELHAIDGVIADVRQAVWEG